MECGAFPPLSFFGFAICVWGRGRAKRRWPNEKSQRQKSGVKAPPSKSRRQFCAGGKQAVTDTIPQSENGVLGAADSVVWAFGDESMRRRWFLVAGACSAIAAVLGWLGIRLTRRESLADGTGFDRVVFVCTNGSDYSPGVYVHGGAGGSVALQTARDAAPFMRAAEVGDAVAGLCGYLSQRGGGGARSGLSLLDSPKPKADGSIDWQAYCGWNVDVVLINLRTGTAECYSSQGPPNAAPKVVVARIEGLALARE